MIAHASFLDRLAAFPFRRLAALLDGIAPPADLTPIDLALGEPRHPPPPLLARTVAEHAHLWNRYPPPAGSPDYRRACAEWLVRRYRLPADAVDPDRHVLALAGTKEGLFTVAGLVAPAPDSPRRLALMPDPLYGVYYGAAVAWGLEPRPLAATREHGFLPDLDALDEDTLARTAIFYLCSPSNPQGAVADAGYLARALELARRFDFLLVLDECYAEIHDGVPPPGGLEVAFARFGDFAHLLVFHSLSKRSSAPGLRAGFVAGDPALVARFLHLRAYGAPVVPLPLAAAAARLWRDEAHVAENRARYLRKFDLAGEILAGRYGFRRPAGGFFLWLEVDDGERAAVELWRRAGVRVLPGGYLSVGPTAAAPGRRYVRVALVHDEATTAEALRRLVAVLG